MSQYIHAEKYESDEVKLFSESSQEEPQNLAFLSPTMKEHLESTIPGKKVLDIGCGTGDWCHKIAQSGAKSVNGFDIQEEMVQLAKQATSQFSTVKICVGDVMDVPYDDNTFDVAISFYVTCSLRLEAVISHFKEMHRVLAPGGKALVVSYSRPAFEKIFLRNGTDRAVLKSLIMQKLTSLPSFPSQDQINDAFRDLHDIIQAPFIIDQNGKLQQVTDADTLTNGQAIWSKTQIMTFPDYFYDDHFFQEQIKATGLIIENAESYYTEERRIAYNSSNPEIPLDKGITDNPPFVMYHLTKPTNR